MFSELKKLCQIISDSNVETKEIKGVKHVAFIRKNTGVDIEKLKEVGFRIIEGDAVIEKADAITLTCGYRISKYLVVVIDKQEG